MTMTMTLEKGRKSKEEHFYNEKESRGYKNIYVSQRGMYKLVMYYGQSKIMPQMKMPVVNTASMEAKCCYLYWFLVYSLNCALEYVMDIQCVPDGKGNQSGEFLRSLVQTNPSVLAQRDSSIQNDTPI